MTRYREDSDLTGTTSWHNTSSSVVPQRRSLVVLLPNQPHVVPMTATNRQASLRTLVDSRIVLPVSVVNTATSLEPSRGPWQSPQHCGRCDLQDVLSAEVEQYYGQRTEYVDDVLTYWHNQSECNDLSTLCQLAEMYLGMASASVPVECLFSSAALIANGKRSSLKPINIIDFTINSKIFIYRRMLIFWLSVVVIRLRCSYDNRIMVTSTQIFMN